MIKAALSERAASMVTCNACGGGGLIKEEHAGSGCRLLAGDPLSPGLLHVGVHVLGWLLVFCR
jgi:hypothetical protein